MCCDRYVKSCLLLALASVFWCHTVIATITSTGTFSNANFVWAQGIAGLKFTFTDECATTSCSYSWAHDGSTILLSRSFSGALTCSGTSDYGLVCSSDGLKLVSTITILNALTKNLTEISITGATAGSFSRTITLLTCLPFPGASVLSSSGCSAYQYNCQSIFGCDNGYVGNDFTRTCTFDATWDNTNNGCAKNLTFQALARDGGIAIGSTARVMTSVIDGIPINDDYTINWKAGTVIVASYSLATSGAGTVTYPASVFEGRISLLATAAANMTAVVQNLSSSDNGTEFSVSASHGTLDAGSSNTVELLVKECPQFSDAKPVEETCNTYHFDCTTTFRCNVAGNIFTATCLSDATFDSRSNCACCPTLDSGKIAAAILGGTYLIILLVTAILSGTLEPKYSGPPTSADTETSGDTHSIIFQYTEGKVEKHTLKVNVGKISNGSTAAVTGVKHNCVGKLSWTSNGDNNQAYLVLVVRESVVMEETIVIGSSYMHWMASSCEYTYVIVAIGNGQLGKPHLYTTDKSAYYQNFWAWLLFLLSLILIAVGVWLMVSFPNSNCCTEACDPCALSANGHVGWVLAVLAISILWGLLAWIFVETRCPSCFKCWSPVCGVCAGLCCCCYYCRKSNPAKGGSGNSEPEAARMMTENV